ncbi:MAG TPA: histidine kinase dimerization/phospho-acceptor domain-containing protein [candidate division Zixibacteria bacterium]|nr:histidine kinase dimerization/phospho-acceptor domain-containing protein [candidate division Zixibacteria bacterium]
MNDHTGKMFSPHKQTGSGRTAPTTTCDSPEGLVELKRFAAALLELNHDLNNPLAGVVGYLELAMTSHDDLPEDTRKMLANVQKSADLLEKVIGRLTSAKRRLQTSVDISELEALAAKE